MTIQDKKQLMHITNLLQEDLSDLVREIDAFTSILALRLQRKVKSIQNSLILSDLDIMIFKLRLILQHTLEQTRLLAVPDTSAASLLHLQSVIQSTLLATSH
jgi:hypothetical protein